MSSFPQSLLYQTFLKIINITITDKTTDELARCLSAFIDMIQPTSPPSKTQQHSKHKRDVQEFIKKGYHMQLLQHLFSSYSLLCAQWIDSKRSELIFGLILSPQIPPHISIECMVTLWKAYVAEHIDTEQPSFSVKQETYSLIANDIIHLMKQLLSQHSHFMLLLADWGTKTTQHRDVNKMSVDPQCEQNIRCLIGIHDLFAAYFYLYRDYFRSLQLDSTNDDEDKAKEKHPLYEHYQFFQRKAFIKYLVETSITIIMQYSADRMKCEHQALHTVYESSMANNQHLQNLCKGTALFWSVLVRVGNADLINKVLIRRIKQHIESNGNFVAMLMGSVLIENLIKLPAFEKWFESFLIALSHDAYHQASYIENIKFLIHLLHRILDDDTYRSQMEYVLAHKLIIKKTLPLHTLDYIIAVLNYLTADDQLTDDRKRNEQDAMDEEEADEDEEDECLLIETMREIGNVWQSTSFVCRATYAQQQYLSRALVLLIQYVTQRLALLNKLDDASTIIPFLFNGVQSRFSSDILEIRHLGMVVAQQYSKVFRNMQPLNFGADLSNVFESKRAKFKCGDIEEVARIIQASKKIDYQFACILLPKQKHSDSNNDINASDTVQTGISGIENNIKSDKLRTDEYMDDEAAVDESWLNEMRKKDMQSDSEHENVWSSDSEDEIDRKHDNDEEELEEHSLSDDEEDLRKVPLPSYIRDCWDLLASKQKPDAVESGLVAATSLIRNHPSDLKHVCIGLCRTLLHLQNEFSIKNFGIYKRNALVALIVTCPNEILSYLPHQLYTKEWSVGVKLEILTVLVDGARELGNLSALNEMYVAETTEQNTTQPMVQGANNDGNDLSIISQHRTTSEKERWKIIDARVAMKTKRWASKPKHVPLKENKFASVATKFLYPILNGYHENEAFLFEFPVLHTRILFALGCCIECSGRYGVDTVQIAKDVFELILSIYYLHKLPEIRRTSVFVLSRILLHVPTVVLKEQSWFVTELNDLVSNLIDMVSNDSDYATRDLARLCLTELKQVF